MASDVAARTSDLSNVVNVAPPKRLTPAGNVEPEAWGDGWRRNEFSYLRDRLEAVEHQLRRRTVVLSAALVLSLGLAAGLAAITFMDAPWTEWARASLKAGPTGSPSPAAEAPSRPRLLRESATPAAD